jgi:hypothetical protein
MSYGKDSGKKDIRQKSFEARMDAEKKMREAQNRGPMKSEKRDTRRGKRG